MDLVFEDGKKRIIKKEDISFSLKTSGLYLIEIVARVKGEKQLGGSDDEDLRIEINKKKFPLLKNPERYIDSPVAFAGGKLKGLKETICFVLSLDLGKHILSLIPDQSANLESIRIFKVSSNLNLENLDITTSNNAEDGERYPWITYVISDTALIKFTANFKLKRRFIDSDDVKVIIDGNVQKNYQSIFHKFWYFIASIIRGEIQDETFNTNFSPGLHYIEFWADRMPELKKITFFGLSASQTDKTIEEKVRDKAIDFGFDSEMILRLVKKESTFNPKSLSPKGAKGLFQLTDITIKQIANLGFKIDDPYDVDQNIQGGMIYFKWLYELYENQEDQLEKTLAAWNYGMKYVSVEGSLDTKDLPLETIEFIKYILNRDEI